MVFKALKPKVYPENPRTLGEHLKRRRKELRLLQREAAKRLGIDHFTYINWEKGHTHPYATSYPAIIAFLGYDPSDPATALADRVRAKRRQLGVTFSQVAQYLGWDEGSLTRYLNGDWPFPRPRRAQLEALLTASQDTLASIYSLPRRARQKAS
jgi:transcriptional regulator with XRE-family HTH domain